MLQHITQPPPQHLFNQLDMFLFIPNTTPIIYHFSTKQALKCARRCFTCFLNNPLGNPCPYLVFLMFEIRLQSREQTQEGIPLDTCATL